MADILRLTKPVKFGSQEISELEFMEPTGKDMAMLKNEMTWGDLLQIAAKLCNQPLRVMHVLGAKDCRNVVEHTSFLLADGD